MIFDENTLSLISYVPYFIILFSIIMLQSPKQESIGSKMKKRNKKKNIFEAITFNHKDKANENIIKMIIKAKSGESKNYAKVHLSNPNDLSL